jgi:NADH dehydrogenase FAD-containing subunit
VTEAPIDVDGVPVADSNAPDGHHTLRFDYAVYALGSRLPAPIDIWDASQHSSPSKEAPESATPVPVAQKPRLPVFKKQGTKDEAVEWLKRCQERVASARSVLIVGGGALGIRMPTFTTLSIRQ